MNEPWNNMLDSVGLYLPNLVGALVVLVAGTLAALLIAVVVRSVLHRTTVDNRIAKLLFGDKAGSNVPVEHSVGKGLFFLLMLFVLVAFFQALKLTGITDPLNNLLTNVLGYLPRIAGAGVLVLIAWLLATALRRVVQAALQRAKFGERPDGQAGGTAGCYAPLGKTLPELVYWLVFLLFLPGILDTLGLQGPLEPVKELLNKVFAFMPNIFAAAIIVLIGWFVAGLVRKIVTNLLAATGLDRLGARIGLGNAPGALALSGMVGLVLYVAILFPVAIAGLNALQLEAITQPASAMLGLFLNALPLLFGAALLLLLCYVAARLVATLATKLLVGMGFNNLFTRLGIRRAPASCRKAIPRWDAGGSGCRSSIRA